MRIYYRSSSPAAATHLSKKGSAALDRNASFKITTSLQQLIVTLRCFYFSADRPTFGSKRGDPPRDRLHQHIGETWAHFSRSARLKVAFTSLKPRPTSFTDLPSSEKSKPVPVCLTPLLEWSVQPLRKDTASQGFDLPAEKVKQLLCHVVLLTPVLVSTADHDDPVATAHVSGCHPSCRSCP